MKNCILPFLVLFTTQALAGGSSYSANDNESNLYFKKTGLESQQQYQTFLKPLNLPGFSDPIKIISSDEVKSADTVYAEIFKQASLDLQQAETLISMGDYAQALAVSKVSLDSVRTKVGINPKAKVQDKFALSYATLSHLNSKEELDVQFQNLNLATRDGVTMTLSKKSSGYYLDLLNLMKRVNLIYIRAFTESLKKQATSGNLLKRDIEKIRDDIAEISAIPLYFFEPETGKMLLVFDFEVTNSDQNYLFNRELFVFMLANQNIFGAKNEKEADQAVAQKVEEIRSQFRDDLQTMEINFSKFDDSIVENASKNLQSNFDLDIQDDTNKPFYSYIRNFTDTIKAEIAKTGSTLTGFVTKNPAQLLNFKSCLSSTKPLLSSCQNNNSCNTREVSTAIIGCSIYSQLVLQTKSTFDAAKLRKCLVPTTKENNDNQCVHQTYDLDSKGYEAIKKYSSFINRTVFMISNYASLQKIMKPDFDMYMDTNDFAQECLTFEKMHTYDYGYSALARKCGIKYETYIPAIREKMSEYREESNFALKKAAAIGAAAKSYMEQTLSSLPND